MMRGREGSHSTVIDVEPDYAIYFLIGGLSMAGAVIAVSIIVRRRKVS